jgi:condensin complex subunit 3
MRTSWVLDSCSGNTDLVSEALLSQYADNSLSSESGADESQATLDTPSTRLASIILSTLLPLMISKEKTVRYRSTQILSHMINTLDSIDDEYYQLLRAGLLKRIRDKEPMVRVQAILGLGRLAGNEAEEDIEDGDSDNDDRGGLLEKLLEVLQNDPSADVRRSLLLNLPLTPSTLPYLLERARDVDPATRRALYSRLLPALGDFRHLSLSMREKLLRWGLRDRDENVRKAAAKLFRERWIEDCAGTREAIAGALADEAAPPSIDGLLELLERIDVVNSGVENGIALEAMKGFWEGRPDYRDTVVFDDAFWAALNAEKVFMARTFNDFCRSEGGGKFEALVEGKLPEVTKLAFYLQRSCDSLTESIRKVAEAEEGEEEDVTVEQEFIVEQLLHIAHTLDYSDEVGRRKMFALLRETLAIPELPEGVTKLVIEVLRGVCGGGLAGEREFCGIVLEAVAEVHDTITGDEAMDEMDDESFHSAKSELSDDTPTKSKKKSKQSPDGADEEEDEEKAIKEIMINMQCLRIAQCMLENIEGNLQQNVHLVTMLNNLVVPAVRSHEAPIRERGLLCLGLCCLLDKTLAEENLSLFLHCFNKGHDALQVTSLHVLSDILTAHPTILVPQPSSSTDDASVSAMAGNQKAVFKIFAKALKASSTPDVQSAGTTALCKLMLGSIIKDEDLLRALVISYFEPSTAENAAVRQALSYFLPVYCHSRRENMERMGKVGVAVVHALMGIVDELDEEEEMVGMSVVGAHVVDWTDARKLVVPYARSVSWDEMGRKEVKALNADIHLDLAVDILEKIVSTSCPSNYPFPSLILPRRRFPAPYLLEKLS